MPAASARESRTRGTRPRGTAVRRSGPAAAGVRVVARVRWDRLGRIAMLFVLCSLLFLYLSTGLHILSKWGQSRHEAAAVATLESEHRKLVSEHNLLSSQSTLEREARELGMIRPGEQPYIVGNLPKN